MSYDHLNADELSGITQADYLIGLDANLRVVDGDVTIFDEPGFPVVELARSLRIWLETPKRGDFEFASMSFEEIGSIAFRQTAAGWRFDSAFEPDASTATTTWAAVESCCRRLIARVEADLAALGIDPEVALSG